MPKFLPIYFGFVFNKWEVQNKQDIKAVSLIIAYVERVLQRASRDMRQPLPEGAQST